MKLLCLCLTIGAAAAAAHPLQSPSGPESRSRLASGIWIDRDQVSARLTDRLASRRLNASLQQACTRPTLVDQDDEANLCVLGKALVFAGTGLVSARREVLEALEILLEGLTYNGRALALGRKLAAYVIAADLVDLKMVDPVFDRRFRATIRALLTAPTVDGPAHLTECHERRPNNWGTHCGASRAAVAAYLGDADELARVAQVFKGYLGDRSAYAGFTYGSDLSWQCDPAAPVGINPSACAKKGHSIDGVLPDDQRRGGRFTWPPPKENYVYEALQGALVQAVILHRAGYDAFTWQDQALLRAFQWLHVQARFPPEGDDTWLAHLVNYYYGTAFPARVPSRPGKNIGWTDWTHFSRPPALDAASSPQRQQQGGCNRAAGQRCFKEIP